MLDVLASFVTGGYLPYFVYLSTECNRLVAVLESDDLIVQTSAQGFLIEDTRFVISNFISSDFFIITVQLANEGDSSMIEELKSNFTDDVAIAFSAPLEIPETGQVTFWTDKKTPDQIINISSGDYEVFVTGRISTYQDVAAFPDLETDLEAYWNNHVKIFFDEEENLSDDLGENWVMFEAERKPNVLTITFIPVDEPVETQVYLPKRRPIDRSGR
ncbi:MAG: hypothetical protein AAFY20_27045 [Cyanobacteria bacterium J06639_14]